MRNGTLLFLLVLVALAIVFGAAKVFATLALMVLAFTLAIVLCVVLFLWLARRRMRRSLGDLHAAMQQHAAAHQGSARPDVIDVDAKPDPDAPSR